MKGILEWMAQCIPFMSRWARRTSAVALLLTIGAHNHMNLDATYSFQKQAYHQLRRTLGEASRVESNKFVALETARSDQVP